LKRQKRKGNVLQVRWHTKSMTQKETDGLACGSAKKTVQAPIVMRGGNFLPCGIFVFVFGGTNEHQGSRANMSDSKTRQH